MLEQVSAIMRVCQPEMEAETVNSKTKNSGSEEWGRP
jgi:hypothetical protein